MFLMAVYKICKVLLNLLEYRGHSHDKHGRNA